MREFNYKAISSTGGITTGSIEAESEREALAMLAKKGLRPLSVSRKGGVIENNSKTTPDNISKSNFGGEKTSLKLFKKLLQLCGSGGMPVGDALCSLSLRSLDLKTKAISKELYKDLSEGKTLSDAMKKHPKMFDSCTVHLVEAGESAANLAFVFENIINYIESRRKLRKTIVSALAYPIFLCIMASAVVLLFLFFMLPQIESMMANMGAAENTPIVMMKAIGAGITYGFPAIAITAILSILAISYARKKSDDFKASSDNMLLKTPILGALSADADICRFATLASALFASGVNATETFRLAEKAVKNLDIKRRIQAFRIAVNDGAPISSALKKYDIIDSEDIDIVSVGERTGSLVGSFTEIAQSRAESLDRRIKLATTALGGVALGGAFTLVLIFAMGIVLSILGLSQGMLS